MRRIVASVLLWLPATCGRPPASDHGLQAAQQPKIVVITRYDGPFRRAVEEFHARHGLGRVRFHIASESLSCAELEGARLVYVHGRLWTEAMRTCKQVAAEMARQGAQFAAATRSLLESHWPVKMAPGLERAEEYLRYGGPANLLAFLETLSSHIAGFPSTVPPPSPSPEVGIYHPAAPAPFAELSQYLAWYRQVARVPTQAPLVGITFFSSALHFGETAVVDTLIEALERRGIGVVPVFGWPLTRLEPLLLDAGQPVVRLLLGTSLPMANPENEAFLHRSGLRMINLITTAESREVWEASLQGLPPSRAAVQVGTPERTGAVEPMIVGVTEKGSAGNRVVPLADRVEAVAERVGNWLRLMSKPNSEKRIVLIYYNNPPGKASLGASYLNLMPSLRNILDRLRQEGYATCGRVPSEDELRSLLLLSGRNPGEYAEGEIHQLVTLGKAILMPLSRYKALYEQLHPRLRQSVEARWGPPEAARQMVFIQRGEPHFIIPGLTLCNVFLGPQPLRAVWEEAEASTHDRNAPPPHHYIAAYLWYRHEFRADALVHLGRHGTLEWLPGKDVAQAPWDAGEALVGNLPHAYFYVVDGGGEFLQVKRRAGGVLISHLTPLLVNSGLPPELQKLRQSVENYRRTSGVNAALAAQYASEVRQALMGLPSLSSWGLHPLPAEDGALIDAVEARLHDLEEQIIPLGLHAIGSPLDPQRLTEGLTQFLRFSLRPEEKDEVEPRLHQWAAELAAGGSPQPDHPALARILPEARRWLSNLRESPSQELLSLVRFLEGRHLPTGVSGDPLRVPEALPTGRNMHDLDPRSFPTPAAWQIGRRMAEELLRQQREKLGRYPEKVSFVLWYGETTRHQGIAEAQALALLGVEPVWNERGQVEDVRLIPVEKLGRPRVDVLLTVSGLYRDAMPDKLALLDRAVQLAAAAPDGGAIRRNSERVEGQLRNLGLAADQAGLLASARIFGPAPGAFGTGLAGMIESARDGGDQGKVAEAYLRNMGYAYSSRLSGVAAPAALRNQLAHNEVVIHSRSTNLYGVLDNDETFQFAGGLHAATTLARGSAPDLLISNVRRPGAERLESMSHFLTRELRSRALNPRWIEGMKASGYAGARQMAREIEHLYGLRTTAPDQVPSQVWQEALDVLIKDRYQLGLGAFFDNENPHARQEIAARLLEIERQGAYRFSDADRRVLVKEYVESVRRFGAACSSNVCDNRDLQRYLARLAAAGALPGEAFLRYQTQLSASLRPPARAGQVAPQAPARRRPASPAGLTPLPLFDTVRTYTWEQFARWRQRDFRPEDLVVLLVPFLGGLLLAGYYRRAPQRPLVYLDCRSLARQANGQGG